MSEKKRTSFYLDGTIIERLREMAEAERRSMSAQIEYLVDEASKPARVLVDRPGEYVTAQIGE